MNLPLSTPTLYDDIRDSSRSRSVSFRTAEIWKKSLWLWFIALGALLALNAIVTQGTFHRLDQQHRQSVFVRGIRIEFIEYLSALKDLESGQRGYLLTGDKEYLQNYTSRQNQLKALTRDIRSKALPESRLAHDFVSVVQLTDRKIEEMSKSIHLFEIQGRSVVTQAVEQNEEKLVMDQIRIAVNRITDHQEMELLKLSDDIRLLKNRAAWLSLITSISAIIFLGILYIYTRKTLEQRAALLRAQQSAAQRVSQALEEKERAFDELTQVNKVKDEFLAIVSHELRTPLNAILGWATLLKEGASEEEYREGLQSIERNARSQSLLIEDLLDVSRVVTGKIRLSLGRTDLRDIVRAVAESAKPALDARQISLSMHLSDDAPTISGDADRLQQVAWNLLSNAIKFTPKGGKIEILTLRQDSSLLLKVRDTGQGFSSDFLPQMFNRFTQADSSTTREQGGLGLGLAIAKHLVELHGGRISAKSDGPGLGAEFAFEIPITAVFDTPAASGNAPQGAAKVTEIPGEERLEVSQNRTPDLKDVRILLSDDQPDTLRVLSSVLIRCGARITTAGTAAEALARLAETNPQVFVSDIGLPDFDGYELIRRIRALKDSHLATIPALALTAFARNEDRDRALEAGFNDHLAKPADALDFARRIHGLVEKH